jgi:hypothetical protein
MCPARLNTINTPDYNAAPSQSQLFSLPRAKMRQSRTSRRRQISDLSFCGGASFEAEPSRAAFLRLAPAQVFPRALPALRVPVFLGFLSLSPMRVMAALSA